VPTREKLSDSSYLRKAPEIELLLIKRESQSYLTSSIGNLIANLTPSPKYQARISLLNIRSKAKAVRSI
jgi:hypothetical protein